MTNRVSTQKFQFTLLGLFFCAGLCAQVITNHPLQIVNQPVHSSEINIFQTNNAAGTVTFPVQADLVHFNTDSGLTTTQRLGVTDTFKLSTSNVLLQSKNYGSVNCIATDNNGDSYDEMFYAFSNAANGITLAFPTIDKTTLKVTSIQYDTIVTGATNTDEPRIKLAKINLGINHDAVIVAYHDYTTHHINLYCYARNTSSQQWARVNTIQGDTLEMLNGKAEVFDIVGGNFDGALGNNDFVLATVKRIGSNSFVFLSTYNAINFGFGVAMNYFNTKQFYQIGGTTGFKNISLASGKFNPAKPSFDQIAVGSMYLKSGGNSEYVRRIQLAYCDSSVSVSPQGNDSISFVSAYFADSAVQNYTPGMSFTAGQLSPDASEEMVFAINGSYDVFDVNGNLQPIQKANGTGGTVSADFHLAVNNSNYIDIADVDYDLENDIIIVTTYDNGNNLQYLSVNVAEPSDSTLNSLTTKGAKTQLITGAYNGTSNMFRYAVAFAELRGGIATLREPSVTPYTKFQPLVVINTPPYHFDVLQGQTLDVNNFFSSSPMDYDVFTVFHSSKYTETQTQNTTLETALKSDWGLSAGLTLGGKILGIKLETNLTVRYGEEFSNTNISSNTQTINTEATADGDDVIYAVLSDYDAYEYPVDSSGINIGYVLAVVRTNTPNVYTWVNSRDNAAYEFTPDHEVGNILSYAKDNAFADYAGQIGNPIFNNVAGYSVSQTYNSAASFTMSSNDFTTSGVSNTKTFGIEAGVSTEFWVAKLNVNGTYSNTAITSHTSTATSFISYDSKVGYGTDPTLPYTASYLVRPYVYWGRNGAINLNYSVVPSDSNQAGPTLWSHYYKGLPDLSLVLPWRLYPEKWYSEIDSTIEKRNLTKSLAFDRRSIEAGDTLTITAFIQNYSMTDFNGNVEFQFYLGNPDFGGTLLTNIDGNSTLTVQNFQVLQQNRAGIVFRTKFNQAYGSIPQIYVVIDPYNKIVEVHEDNNRGTNIVFPNSYYGNVSIQGSAASAQSWQARVYPNPATANHTQVEVITTEDAHLKVVLTDALGNTLSTLCDRQLPKGNYLFPLIPATMANGVYFVSVWNGSRKQKTIPLSIMH